MLFKTVQLRQGQIVTAKVQPPRGIEKARPAVILTRTEQILEGAPLALVAISTSYPNPAPEYVVELPWFPRRHPTTGLCRRSAAICNWVVAVVPESILDIRGLVPPDIMLKIVLRVAKFTEPPPGSPG